MTVKWMELEFRNRERWRAGRLHASGLAASPTENRYEARDVARDVPPRLMRKLKAKAESIGLLASGRKLGLK